MTVIDKYNDPISTLTQDQSLFIGRRALGMEGKEDVLQRIICLKKMPSSDVTLARGLQLTRFAKKLESIAQTLVDNGEITNKAGQETLKNILEMMSVLDTHAINQFLAYEQQELIRAQGLALNE